MRKLLPMLLMLLVLSFCAGAEETCPHANLTDNVTEKNACQGYEIVETVCADCGAVLSQNTKEIPVEHAFSEWTMEAEATCESPETWKRECTLCHLAETENRGEPAGHQYGEMILLSEPDCTKNGSGLMECLRCGQQQEVTVAPLGHLPEEHITREPTAERDGEKETVCQRCGELLKTESVPYTKYLYNNSITSLGPCTRDLIGGNDWYRLTPLDLTLKGTFTYPLIASNRYTVGKMTVNVTPKELSVSYQFDTKSLKVNSETLIIYKDLEEVKNPRGLRIFDFNSPISIEEHFPDDKNVILSAIILADYDTASDGVSFFTENKNQMRTMTEEILKMP